MATLSLFNQDFSRQSLFPVSFLNSHPKKFELSSMNFGEKPIYPLFSASYDFLVQKAQYDLLQLRAPEFIYQEEFKNLLQQKQWIENKLHFLALSNPNVYLSSAKPESQIQTQINHSIKIEESTPSSIKEEEILDTFSPPKSDGKRRMSPLHDSRPEKKLKCENSEEFIVSKEREDSDSGSSAKQQQSKWKNFPGHLMFAIKRGCQSFFEKEKGIRLQCIENILAQSPESHQQFKDFILKYKSIWKTYQTIRNYLDQHANETLKVLLAEMVEALLADENQKDFEAWLEETRMNSKTKDAIRVGKKTIKKDFISRLYLKRLA